MTGQPAAHELHLGVECLLCGRVMHSLAMHLKHRHSGMTSAEYRERFPGALLISPHLSAIRKDRWTDQFAQLDRDGYPVTWTQERVLAAILLWVQKRGKPPTANGWKYAAKNRPTTGAVVRAFGSWNAALVTAGLPTREVGERYRAPAARCKHGHPLSGDNLLTRVRYDKKNPRVERRCRECHRRASREFYRRSVSV